MIVVFGGAYQGKLDYVLERYPGKTVFSCSEDKPDPDWEADILYALHRMILAQIRAGVDTADFLAENLPKLKEKIIICDDISCGVVPIDPEMRQWREATGRALSMLAGNADAVIRVFCGIGSYLAGAKSARGAEGERAPVCD